MNENIYDIAVIGLGPAGSTISRLLSDKFKIIALDKKNKTNNSSFEKPCGGLLSPDAQEWLIKFDLTLPKDILVDPQIFSVKTFDLKTNIINNYQKTYVNMNRHKFDLWLESLIPKHVNVKNNVLCEKIEKTNDVYEVTYNDNGEKIKIKAKYIVGADGANSLVRKTLYGKNTITEYMSIQQWFEEINDKPFYSCIFEQDITDACAWSISKDNVFILGGAFKKEKSRENFDKLREKLKSFGFKYGKLLKTEACIVLKPTKFSEFYHGKENAFLLGEAAGFISPSSFEGISYAFSSAYELSRILNNESLNANKEYKNKTFKIKIKVMTKIIKAKILYNQFLRKIVMKSKFQNIDIIK